jgi:hypothetical protein
LAAARRRPPLPGVVDPLPESFNRKILTRSLQPRPSSANFVNPPVQGTKKPALSAGFFVEQIG